MLILALLAAGLAGVVRGQTVTEFPIPTANSGPQGIAAGPDGNLWFTENASQIGRITTGICIPNDTTVCLSPREPVILSVPRSRTPIKIDTRPE